MGAIGCDYHNMGGSRCEHIKRWFDCDHFICFDIAKEAHREINGCPCCGVALDEGITLPERCQGWYGRCQGWGDNDEVYDEGCHHLLLKNGNCPAGCIQICVLCEDTDDEEEPGGT